MNYNLKNEWVPKSKSVTSEPILRCHKNFLIIASFASLSLILSMNTKQFSDPTLCHWRRLYVLIKWPPKCKNLFSCVWITCLFLGFDSMHENQPWAKLQSHVRKASFCILTQCQESDCAGRVSWQTRFSISDGAKLAHQTPQLFSLITV